MTDPERYLRKARESLVSAKADVAAGRYNSAANRAYYAAFQAAIAALIHNDIRPAQKGWQHKFVINQFSGKLVKRRKMFPAGLVPTIERLFQVRVVGDYETVDVSKGDAGKSFRNATLFVEEIERTMKLNTIREAAAEYQASVRAAPPLDLAEQRIDELQALILAKYPEAKFEVIQLGPSDYRLNAYLKLRSVWAFGKVLNGRTIDILVDDDIWIVVIPHPMSSLRELRNN